MIQSLPIERICKRHDARVVNPGAVASLVESIGTVGLINPIRVRASGDGWEVIAGLHRLTACQNLGLVDIDCLVVDDDDLHAELAMIDENLMRAELSASERASQTARRKAIYLELHPETAHGANLEGGGVAKLATPDVPAFAKATASATGQSERAVRRDADRGKKVIPEVMDLIRGTKLDTGKYLDQIKKFPPNDQVIAVKRDLSIAKQQERDRQKSATKSKLDADVRQRAAKACAEIIAEYVPHDALDHFRSNLAVTNTKDLATELANLLGESVMGRRFA